MSYDKENITHLVTLTEQDFQEANFHSGELKFTVSELINFWKIPSFLFLWENQALSNPKKALFYSPKADLIKKVLNNFKGVTKGKGVMFLINETSLALAKEKVLEII